MVAVFDDSPFTHCCVKAEAQGRPFTKKVGEPLRLSLGVMVEFGCPAVPGPFGCVRYSEIESEATAPKSGEP
jgi:hypothetical protein